MTWQPDKNRRMRGEAGFSLIEVLVVVLILGIVAAMAIPAWRRIQQNARLNGDAHNVGEALAVAKMRAGAAFTYSRVFLFTGTDKTQYFRVDTWNTTLNCWVPDGLPNPANANCITTSAVTGYENNLSTGVSAGFGSLSTVPSNFVTSVAQAGQCWGGGTAPMAGSQIANTSCIAFNSRGFPTVSGGFYLTDGTRVFAIVTNTMGLMHSYVSPAASASWNAY
jgi:prepilin-type N-terminal cleavage/methylation domain-containing protein